VNVHVVLPDGIDDPAAPSGGNSYDRRVCDGLRGLGWTVREHPVRGAWPAPVAGDRAALAGVLAALPDDALVLVDGLVGSCAPEVLGPQAARLRLVLLVHMPLDDDAEGAALAAARSVLATSGWTRDLLAQRYGVRAEVATPGVDRAPLATGSDGSALLCVGAVTPLKGHDVLNTALARLDLPFTCTCVGSLDRDPAYAAAARAAAPDRVVYAGVLTGAALAAAYDRADLLVHPSRAETYGMVLTEALARGVPVLACDVGGVREALGPDGTPGLLAPPGDAAALADLLRAWLLHADLRDRLRVAARARRATLTGWDTTAVRVAAVLGMAAAGPGAR
jgi:glycosyltransferase involved in cell wall biosynthesis